MSESWVGVCAGYRCRLVMRSGLRQEKSWACGMPRENGKLGKVVRVAGAPTVTGYLPFVVRSTAQDGMESLELTLPPTTLARPRPPHIRVATVRRFRPRHCRYIYTVLLLSFSFCNIYFLRHQKENVNKKTLPVHEMQRSRPDKLNFPNER